LVLSSPLPHFLPFASLTFPANVVVHFLQNAFKIPSI
jgi:hypothetical protein